MLKDKHKDALSLKYLVFHVKDLEIKSFEYLKHRKQ